MIVIKVAQCNVLFINQEVIFEPCLLDWFFIFLPILEPQVFKLAMFECVNFLIIKRLLYFLVHVFKLLIYLIMSIFQLMFESFNVIRHLCDFLICLLNSHFQHRLLNPLFLSKSLRLLIVSDEILFPLLVASFLFYFLKNCKFRCLLALLPNFLAFELSHNDWIVNSFILFTL